MLYYAQLMAHKKRTPNSTLSRFFERVLKHAKQNHHVGKARTADLEEELARIDKRVQATLTKINKEAEKSDTPDDDAKVTAKLERTTRLLTSEMMELSAIYHRQSDVDRIRRFLNKQQEIIDASMDGSKEATGTLDGRISAMHKLMATERSRVAQTAHRERVKFFLSISIAVLSLSISVYALWFQ